MGGVYGFMSRLSILHAALFVLLGSSTFGQSLTDGLVDATKTWLKNVSAGARAELLSTTDEQFLATTPAGDVVVRDQLIPPDTSQAVQRLPPMDTGVVVSRLKGADGPLNATFVLVRQQGAWRVAAIHLSPASR